MNEASQASGASHGKQVRQVMQLLQTRQSKQILCELTKSAFVKRLKWPQYYGFCSLQLAASDNLSEFSCLSRVFLRQFAQIFVEWHCLKQSHYNRWVSELLKSNDTINTCCEEFEASYWNS